MGTTRIWIGTAAVVLSLAACSALTPAAKVDSSANTDGGKLEWLGPDGGAITVSPSSSSDGGPTERVPFALLPEAATNPWSNGEPRIFKDRTPGKAGELIGFGWTGKLSIFKSTNGDSWTFVNATGGESIGTLDVLCVAQDSVGKVHLLFKNGPGGNVEYARVALSHSGSAVSGFASEVKGVILPGSYNTNNDVRGVLQVVRGTGGAEVLVYETTDNTPGANFRLRMGKATSLAPQTTDDFVGLDGAAGVTTVFSSATFNNHDHAALFAQVGSSKDLWVFFGPVEAEFGAPDDTFTTRIRLTPSGPATWSVGQPIQMVGSDAVSSPELLSVYGTQNYVWFVSFHPMQGLTVDRVDAQGTYATTVFPSPEPVAHRNGWAAFSVADDERRAWLIWNSMSRNGPGADDRTRQAFWDGKQWMIATDPMAGDTWGMGGSIGWGEGVVATRLDLSDYRIAVSTIRGGSLNP